MPPAFLTGKGALILARFLLALLGLALGGPVAHAREPSVVRLETASESVGLWPHVRVLAEEGADLSWQEALALDWRFEPPQAPHANLGLHREAVWLRVALDVEAVGPARWLLDVNYPSLDRVDLYLVREGRLLRAARLGDHVPHELRPMRTRSHAIELVLEPGRQELLLRVLTTSTMIVPLTLSQPEAYLAREAGTEALQGLFAGIGLFLIVYSLAHWVGLRDAIFAWYAASVAGVVVFFLAYAGLAAEHLWPGQAWLTRNAAPLSVLVAIWGGLLFLERILRLDEMSPALSRLMRALAWFSLAAGAAFVLGLLDYRAAQSVSTALGPMPMLLGVPGAYMRMRRGERIMAFLLAGWGAYAVGVAIMAALLRGYAPANALTQHAFQIGSMVEMTLWIVLLGQRVAQIQREGEHAHREHDTLRSLAQTDALTGLPNRRGLEPILARAMVQARGGAMVAIYMIDLDGFKPVNDRYGHLVGDRLLAAVGARLREHVRRTDFVARLGGDEFVIVAEGFAEGSQATQFGQDLIDAFNVPFNLADGTIHSVGLTIGYVLAPDDGLEPSNLLRHADTALYAGKQGGKHCLRRGGGRHGPGGAGGGGLQLAASRAMFR